MIRLSERLTIVYQNLLPQKDAWDICCDHGYIGAAAYKSANFADIYFVDRVPSIIEKLKVQFDKFVFKTDSASKAIFICAPGQDIKMTLTGTVCITGVGGLAAFEILDGLAKNGFLNADRLVLGPHRDEKKLLELIKNSPQMSLYHLGSDIKVAEGKYTRSLYILERIF